MDTEPAPEAKLSCSEVVGLAVLLGVIAMVVLLLFVGPALKHHFVDRAAPPVRTAPAATYILPSM